MIVNVRTRNDLRDLLRNRASGHWGIGRGTEPLITKVRVFNWEMDQVLKGDYNRKCSVWDVAGKLIIGIKNCRIENFNNGGKQNLYFDSFGTTPFVYSEDISLQKIKGQVVGIVRSSIPSDMSQNEINEYFERLKREIILRGLTKIVFKKGGIPIPEDFISWCQNNGVQIEILSEDEFNNSYPVQNDIFWEDELFEDDIHRN